MELALKNNVKEQHVTTANFLKHNLYSESFKHVNCNNHYLVL